MLIEGGRLMDIIVKIIKYLWNIIQELFKDNIKYVVGVVILFISALFIDNLVLILKSNIPIWIVAIFVVIIILFYSVFLFIIKHNESKSVHKITKYGLEWYVNYKKHKLNSIKGPFCPRCQYELTDSSTLQCQICKTDYTTKIGNGIENLKNNVSKIIEAELRDGKTLISDWHLLYYPNSIFTIRNNGASRMDNVEIKINIIYDGKKDIDSYVFEKINPDDGQIILDPNPMVEIHNILKNLKLVEIKDEIIGMDDVIDDMGILHEMPIFADWVEAKKSFSCQLEVNISYSIKNKLNMEKSKYILKFNMLLPYDYNEYEDHCEIEFNKI